jgi:DNA polymerase-3 subunit gamma/tau
MSDPDQPDATAGDSATPAAAGGPYQVLARKYRPASFDDLIGQDTLVRTLSNAIQTGRVPQAFMLTGVRGVGKTTTARLIARALNCIGPDGQGGPTVQPCGACEHCRAIAGDRHVDVIEMDAASRAGVNDIRDLIDGVRYRPVSARQKVYVVDEVHMLSTQAFNALLKTLEEPPAHATFVFATTEIRKVPVTVMSRCMRFDLRRVDQATLVQHFRGIVDREGVDADDEALAMVARAADGSVRDGLSMLDQAVALSGGAIRADLVKDMLGLADRARIYDLYDAVLGGRPADALDVFADLYSAGADPAVVIQDLLDVTHTLTRLQVVGEHDATAGLPETERTRGREIAKALRPATLSRNWQILLKGLQEAQQAPQPRQAAEMVLIRLIHAAELPPPAEVIRQLREGQGAASTSQASQRGRPDGGEQATASGGPTASAASGGQALSAAPPTPSPAPASGGAATGAPMPGDLRAVVQLCQDRSELKLAANIRQSTHLVRFEPGRIEVRLAAGAPKDLPGRLGQCLTEWTGQRWVVSVSGEAGEPTLAEQDAAREEAERRRLMAHPKVQALLEVFPEARLVAHRGGGHADDAADETDTSTDDGTSEPDAAILGDPDAFEGDDEG